MGTPDFSVPTLEQLVQSKHEVIAVVTQPDKPKGRGKKVTYTPVKEVAIQNNIDVYQPKRVRDTEFINIVKKLNPDVIVVVAFGQILSKELLEIPKLGCINIHASLLPKYRGAGPIQWSIINGEKTTGVTTMFMDVGLDTGDMLLKEEVIIETDETGGSLHDKLSSIGGNLLLETLEGLESGDIDRVKQNDEESTYAPMLDKKMGNIDWTKSANEIEQLIRGLNPWPSAYSNLDGNMVKIWKAEIINTNKMYEAGTICDIIKNKGFVVQCKEKGLLITELQLQGKKRMETAAFLRGANVEVGMSLKIK
jgi:methionyl-tRNA formyltransferase